VDSLKLKGAFAVSQSKSEDNWAQEVMDAVNETFKPTREQAREIRKLKRMGFKDFADVYVEYLQLENQQGPLDYSLKEYCGIKGVPFRSLK